MQQSTPRCNRAQRAATRRNGRGRVPLGPFQYSHTNQPRRSARKGRRAERGGCLAEEEWRAAGRCRPLQQTFEPSQQRLDLSMWQCSQRVRTAELTSGTPSGAGSGGCAPWRRASCGTAPGCRRRRTGTGTSPPGSVGRSQHRYKRPLANRPSGAETGGAHSSLRRRYALHRPAPPRPAVCSFVSLRVCLFVRWSSALPVGLRVRL